MKWLDPKHLGKIVLYENRVVYFTASHLVGLILMGAVVGLYVLAMRVLLG